jgi:hypothetical protein
MTDVMDADLSQAHEASLPARRRHAAGQQRGG